MCAALIELQRQDLMPQDSEVSTMEVYHAIMKPIADITDVIGGEKHVSFSAVRPLIYKLYNSYLKVNTTDKPVGKAMKTAMYTKLLQYYNAETIDTLNIAAFLDPHFKSLSFLDEIDKVSTHLTVKEKICTLLLDSESDSASDHPFGPGSIESRNNSEVNIVSSESSDVTPVAKCKKLCKFMELLSDVMSTVTLSDKTCEEKAKFELQQYVEDSSSDSTVNPLRWWYENKLRYPDLCQLALHYLTIPATSVPSEQAFSISGHIVRTKRACLLPEHIQILVFLVENLP